MLIVRRMTEADIDVVSELECSAFSDSWSKRSIQDTLESGSSIVLVAEKDEEIIGYCISYSVLDEAEIARIAVSTSCRRQGVGCKLIDSLLKICEEKEVSHLMLEVREGNVAARMFYQAYGFGVDGIRKKYYQSPVEDAVLMSMRIPTVPTRN